MEDGDGLSILVYWSVFLSKALLFHLRWFNRLPTRHSSCFPIRRFLSCGTGGVSIIWSSRLRLTVRFFVQIFMRK